MNRLLITILVLASLSLNELAAQSNPAAEISFTFNRQSGSATNQFAVWIEDAQGRHVKTLYATRYTANGGYSRRETSIPRWVKQSGLAAMSRSQVDSITAATPRAGSLSYTWDGTNAANAALPPGNYTIYLEGTLRWENQVLYSAVIRLGQGAAVPAVTTEYTGTPGAEANMIENVRVRTLR